MTKPGRRHGDDLPADEFFPGTVLRFGPPGELFSRQQLRAYRHHLALQLPCAIIAGRPQSTNANSFADSSTWASWSHGVRPIPSAGAFTNSSASVVSSAV